MKWEVHEPKMKMKEPEKGGGRGEKEEGVAGNNVTCPAQWSHKKAAHLLGFVSTHTHTPTPNVSFLHKQNRGIHCSIM